MMNLSKIDLCLISCLIILVVGSCVSIPSHLEIGGTKQKVTKEGHVFSLDLNNAAVNLLNSSPNSFIQKGKLGGMINLYPACRLFRHGGESLVKKIKFKITRYRTDSFFPLYETSMTAVSMVGQLKLRCWFDKNKKSHLTMDDIKQAFGSLALIN